MSLFATFSRPLGVAGGNAERWGIDLEVLGDGRAAVVWTEDGNAASWLRFFDATGTLVGPDLQVTGRSNRSSVTELEDGTLVVAYLDLDDAYGDIVARRYTQDGAQLGADHIIFAQQNLSLSPELTALPDGGYLAVFTSFDSNRYGVFAQRMSAVGTPQGDVFRVNETQDGFQSSGRAVALSNGGFAVTWRAREVDGSLYAVMMRVYAADGTPQSSEIRVNQFARDSQTSPAITALAGGGFAIAWQSDGQDGDGYGIFTRVYAADGVAVGDEFQVNELTFGDQADPTIAARPDGGFSVVWWHAPGSSASVIRLRDFDATGMPLAGAYEGPSTESIYHFGPVLEIGEDGAAYLAGVAQNGASGETDVFVAVSGQTLVGGDEGDRLTGTRAADVIRSGDGNDTIRAGDGADTIVAGSGDDHVTAGDGPSDLRDLVYAGDGDDYVAAGAGNDELRGDAGADTLSGLQGADTLIGGDGDDILSGGALGDLLFGGPDDDFLNGGFGFDRLNGGAGRDRFYHQGVAGHGSDWVQDFSDEDVLVYGGAVQADQFQVNFARTPGAGLEGTEEAFVIFRPTEQVLWALVDGGARDTLSLSLAGGETFDLLA
ncbi:calcium-binding protein [Shimia sp. SDUM112013]|uniref:calcium-binding protein n=1 Tax=Shimia sp. SDUM112013 TaxID=3136160 RepID=UPI0032EDE2B4